MIAITGATGQLGRLVIQALLQEHEVPAQQIVAAVRNPAKAADLAALGVQVREADYSRPDTLDAAFKGVAKVLLVSSSEVGQRGAQHRAVIDAARRAGIKLLAYTSILHADSTPLAMATEHKETEAALRASGLPFVLLRNGWYTENRTAGIGAALQHGALPGAAGDGRISSAARADYAAAAAAVLVKDGQAGRVYELAGDTGHTLAELAAEIARQSGKPVTYQNLSEAAFKAMLVQVGLPDALAGLLADSDAGTAKGGLFDDGRQLSQLIGRPTTPIATTVGEALKAL